MTTLIPWRRTHNVPIRRDEEPGLVMAEFRSEIDRLFERFTGHPLDWFGGRQAAMPLSPSIDVSETDREIIITADVPGVDPQDLDISLSDHLLTVTGEKRQESEQEDEDYYHCERSFGSFRRTIELPRAADVDTMEAESRNGVVTIRVRKQPAATARRIEVKPSTEHRQETAKPAKSRG